MFLILALSPTLGSISTAALNLALQFGHSNMPASLGFSPSASGFLEGRSSRHLADGPGQSGQMEDSEERPNSRNHEKALNTLTVLSPPFKNVVLTNSF